MTKEKLAEILNGREYTTEITKEEEAIAKQNNLVVIFGASDDLMEFRGAINDEIGAYEGTEAYLTLEGLLWNACEDEDCPYFKKIKEATKSRVKAIWHDHGDVSWSFETDIPHAEFNIMEEGSIYCRGIVISLEDIGI